MNKLLPYLERIFLATLAIGYILKLMENHIPILITIGLAGLGVIFFLSAFRPLEFEPTEGEKMGFNEFLGLVTVPKILWISTAVATIGILLYTLQLGNDGYLRMLYIGSSTIAIATLILLGLKATGTKYLNATFPVFYRVFPTFLLVAYILFG